MSFAYDVKKEIANLNVDDTSLKAELYGFLKLKAMYVIRNKQLYIQIKTNSLPIVRRIKSSLTRLYNVDLEVTEKKRVNLDKKNIYILSFQNVDNLCRDLGLIDDNLEIIEEVNLKYPKDAVIRGMFLAKGSVNNPQSSRYHLEIGCSCYSECLYLIKSLEEFGVAAKYGKRKETHLVYVKKAEQIGDVLKIIGSSTCMFGFEDSRIKRDLNNVINRIINCDIANSEKSQKMAASQLKKIAYLEKHVGFENLPIRIMEAATLRVKNPDATLQELSDVAYDTIGIELSKSGLHHRFRELDSYYQAILAERKAENPT